MSTVMQICKHWIRPDIGLQQGLGHAGPAVCPWCEVDKLRGELSLAEEGMANAMQEIEQLRAFLTQAPIARIRIGIDYDFTPIVIKLYTPGLPPGEHDVYLMPEVPSSRHPTGKP